MRKRLLFCTHEQFWPLTGGCTAGNFNLMKFFAQNGYDVTVSTPLYSDPKLMQEKFGLKFKPFSPYYMHRKVSFRMVKYLLYGVLSIFHLISLLRKNEYDIIYVNNTVIAFPFVFIKRFIKTPVIIRYTDFLSGFLYEDKSYPRFLVRLLKYYEYRVAAIFDRIYVITEKMKDELHSVGKIPADKIVVTFDGVDGEVFSRAKVSEQDRIDLRKQMNLPLEAKVVMCHGTIEPHHGEHLLPEIIAKVTGAMDDFYFVLIGVGKGYENIKRKLHGHAKVRMLDFVDYVKIPKYIYASDIGIIPYQKNHSMDLVLTLKLLEYLSVGTPCVLFDLQSVMDVFGRYDFVKASKDQDEFVRNICSLRDFGKSPQAAEIIANRFTWAKVGEIIEADFARLLTVKQQLGHPPNTFA